MVIYFLFLLKPCYNNFLDDGRFSYDIVPFTICYYDYDLKS